eukprot:gnl/Spiro4/22858_TR11275_c0_g1_i1.p1 gnl/Spiro4/22858_TR11275_c0_g1~~gnl/Spiro4/22858_TR11275_c0_g1_i1.p1  ORF type:complete len:282 (+),score=61.77 gnl/Spiro4/22858_TR11275_c0_g1_i1:66-911(+)
MNAEHLLEWKNRCASLEEEIRGLKELLAQTEEIEAEATQLNDRHLQNIKELQQSLSQAEKDIKQTRSAEARLRAQVESLMDKAKEDGKTIEAFQREVDTLKATTEKQLWKIRELEKSNDALENRNREFEDSLHTAEGRADRASEAEILVRSELEELQDSYQTDTQRLKDQIQELKSEIKVLQASNKENSVPPAIVRSSTPQSHPSSRLSSTSLLCSPPPNSPASTYAPASPHTPARSSLTSAKASPSPSRLKSRNLVGEIISRVQALEKHLHTCRLSLVPA